MTPAEYAQALLDYNTGPEPKDPNAPLSDTEQALVDAQGDRIDRDSNT